jgi:hypothetical protein
VKQDQRRSPNEESPLKNELAVLLRRHGAEAIRKTLHELTRGRPAVPVADLFQVWFAIELLLRRSHCRRVTVACARVANKGGIRKLTPKYKLGKLGEIEFEQQTIAGNAEAIRRKYSQAKRLLANDPFLRHALERQLEYMCGGATGPPNIRLEMQESFEISAKRWAKTTRLYPLKNP